jgi:hypothetical protein
MDIMHIDVKRRRRVKERCKQKHQKRQLDEFATNFEKHFSLVSCLSMSTPTRSAWYLDNGVSRHMIKAQDLFSIMMERDSGVHVYLGDDARYIVKGKGIVTFQLDSGGSLDAHNVLYVPSLKNNLLSVSTMEDMSFSITFQSGKVLIHRNNASPYIAVVVVVREAHLYKLQGKLVQALVNENDNLCELWYKRLGNLHYKKFLILRGIFTGLPEFSIEKQGVCRGCALGNNAKVGFPSNESRSKVILDLINSDVSGFDVSSISTWIFILCDVY